MKIFITGATGYVGSRLLPELMKNNHDITCLIRSPEKYANTDIFNNCKILERDITDKAGLRHTMDHMDAVIHLAVSTPLTNTNDNIALYNDINVNGTRNLLEECISAKPKRIICFSSTAAIGMPRVPYIDEKTPLHPINHYGQSKKESEEVVFSFFEQYRLPVITLCFPHIYGPGDIHDFYLIIKLLKKGLLPQVGFRPNLLPLVYISDAIDAILLALTNGRDGEKYIIADDDPHDIRKIRKLVWSALGIDRNYYPFVPKYLGILSAYIIQGLFTMMNRIPPVTAKNIKSIAAGRHISIKKAKKELNFFPKISIETGLQRTMDWYKKEKLL